MAVSILIYQHCDDWDEWVDAFDLLGGKTDDYDPKTQIVSLEVDAADIVADYSLNGGMFPHEIHGAIHMVEEVEVTVKECTWQGYDIINAEEVCTIIEGMEYVTY